jgi:tryptophanyl-tRNA synthetase
MHILSGIKPSGAIHVANYLAMIKPMVEYQDRGTLLCFVANMHSQTTVFDGPKLYQLTDDAIVDLLALGIDPDRSVFWVQSDVPEVAELTWYLNNVTPVGLLQRCHAYKDAVANNIPASAGLFGYPVLMAADILLYQSDIVPVGQDQKQHVEVTRDIAIKFNTTYGEAFTVPEAEIATDVAIVPGIDGQKMSKSYDNTIEIFAPEKPLRKKIMSVVTDSTPVEEPKDPDTNTIYHIYRLLADESRTAEMAEKFRKGGYGYGDAKKELCAVFMDYFAPYRAKREEILKNRDYVAEVRKKGAEKAREIGTKTLETVRRLVGVSAP